MKKECNLVQDLLPNYIEKLTNEETNRYVENHLKECEECTGILKSMKENLSANTEKVEKKTVKYLKKYNRELRLFQIILLILLIAFVLNVGKKFFLLESLSEKFAAVQDLNNFYIKKECYDSVNNSRTMSTLETYYKNGNYLANYLYITGEGNSSEFIFYKNGENESHMIKNVVNGEINVTNDVILNEDDEQAPILVPSPYISNSITDKLYIAIFLDIDKANYHGKKCYIIRTNDYDIYVDAETGLVVKSVIYYSDTIINTYYEFGTVEDSDIVMPSTIE